MSGRAKALTGRGERNPIASAIQLPMKGVVSPKEEYFARWYENPYPDIDVSYEWNNGILEAKPLPNRPQLDLYNWFLTLLQRNIETFRHAALLNLETGFELKMPDPTEPSGQREAVRKPDVGVILDTNPTPWGRIEQRHYEGVCDLVVEAVSDSTRAEILRDTEEKRVDYALGGVKEYFILDPSGEHMNFYRLVPERSLSNHSTGRGRRNSLKTSWKACSSGWRTCIVSRTLKSWLWILCTAGLYYPAITS